MYVGAINERILEGEAYAMEFREAFLRYVVLALVLRNPSFPTAPALMN